MVKRGAHHFPAVPVARIQTAAHLPPTLANKRAADLQKKVTELQSELDATKNSLSQANESKKQALEDLRAVESTSAFQRIQELTTENAALKAQPTADHQLKQLLDGQHHQLHGQKLHIQRLEEQLSRVHWEKGQLEAKVQADNHSRAQLINKLSESDKQKHALTEQLQQLQKALQAARQSPDSPASPDPHNDVHELNKDLQRRIDFLCHENDMLRNEQSRAATPVDTSRLEQSLKESNRKCETLSNEKNLLAMELKTAQAKEERVKAQMDKSEWMNKMLADQLEYCKRNSDLWQEQCKSLSEHLKRGSGGMAQHPQQQHPYYSPPPFPPQSLSAPSFPPAAAFPAYAPPTASPTPSRQPRLRNSATPASLITLDDDMAEALAEVKEEEST